MKISDTDWLLQQTESGLKLGRKIEEAFPKLSTSKLSGGFFEPAQCLLRFLVWIWICESQQQTKQIKETANEVLKRSLSLYHKTPESNAQDQFEFLLLCACVAIGALDLAKQAAEKTVSSQFNSSTYRICANILKLRILGQEDQEAEQFSYLRMLKGTPPPIRVGEQVLWKSFTDRSESALCREVGKNCRKYTKALLESLPPNERLDDTVVMGYWPLNSFWPWTELVLLKLTFGPEKAPILDGFWLPEKLLRRSTI